jgi:glycosyltransferase involved in cell wall biosynthesis
MGACIWYVSKYVAPPGMGSAGGRGYQLMKELARAGDRVVIITSDSNHLAQAPALNRPYLHQSVDGMDLWWIRTFRYQMAKSFRRMLSWLDFEWRLFRMPKKTLPVPDVVVVSSLSLLTILNGFLLRRRYGCRLVFEVRDIWPLTLTEEGGFKPFNPLIRLLAFVERQAYRRADAIVGAMPNLAEHVAKVLGFERSVECVPMGYDEQAIANVLPLNDGYARDFIPEGKFIVAYVGTIGITNALETFLECASELSGHRGIHFLLVGDGDLRDVYTRRYGHLPNLSFGTRIRKEMVQSVLERCDLLYFSTYRSEVWRYGQSLNKVIDYMLSGKPIVASYSGFPSMINEADCGCFVPSGDVQALKAAILRFVAMDPGMREEMGRRGRQWILTHRNYAVLARHYRSILFARPLSSPHHAMTTSAIRSQR